MRMWKPVAWTLGFLATVGVLGATAVIYGGLYNVAATKQHLQPVYTVLEKAMHYSVQRRAREIEVPTGLDTASTQRLGATCYRDHCLQCHGGPGVARQGFGMSMQPLPSPLVEASQKWNTRELYWITRHGIKMSGMPAWQFRLREEELWAVTAFVNLMPKLTPTGFAERIAQAEALRCPGLTAVAGGIGLTEPLSGLQAAPDRGRVALYQYACNTCHTIPGITGSQPLVGPPLGGIASRQVIAGRLANTPANMVAWITHPQQIDPATAMPDLGVNGRDAVDMAAYLATLR